MSYRYYRIAWALLIGTLFFLPARASAQVINIVNADFEDVQIGSPFVTSNPANIPGWTHSGTTGDGLMWHVGYADGGGSVVAAGSGLQFVTLGGGFTGTGTGRWEQTLTGFTPGLTYTLSFKMTGEGAGSFSGPQNITVDFPSGSSTGPQTFTAGASATHYWDNWEQKTEQFIATSSSVDLRFSATTQFDAGLDDIHVVVAVPEPGSLVLIFALAVTVPVMLVGLRRWRARQVDSVDIASCDSL